MNKIMPFLLVGKALLGGRLVAIFLKQQSKFTNYLHMGEV